MAPVKINFAAGSSISQDRTEGGPLWMNAYAEITKGDKKAPILVKATEGRRLFAASVADGPCRAMIAGDTYITAVVGRNIMQTDSGGASNIKGGLASDGHVGIAKNRRSNIGEIGIVSDGLYKVFQTDGELVTVDTPAPAIDIDFIDGFFILTIADGRLFSTGLDDATTISELDFTTAEGSPDRNVRGITRGRDFIVLGEKSFQPYQNDGGTNFPLSPIPGTFQSIGCLAPGSAVVCVPPNGTDTLVWLDDEGIVRKAAGYAGEEISDHDVARVVGAEPNPAKITAFTYSQDGHTFYVLKGTTFTKVYDFSSGKWHDRSSVGFDYWRASSHAKFNRQHIVGDTETGALFVLDKDHFKDGDDHLIWTVEAPVSHNFPYPVRVDEIRVDTLPGRGLNSTNDHDADPKLMMQVSMTGGQTWSQERKIPMGKKGQFKKTAVARTFGITGEDGFLLRVSASAAVRKGIHAGAFAEVTPLRK